MSAAAEPFRIALIGAGRMGRLHLEVLRPSGAVTVAAVVEPLEATRRELAGRGYRTHSGIDELLAAREVDGVLIAAPSDQHLDLVATIARAGLPILCEKPVGVTAADAIAATAAVQRAGVLLQVGYWRRFVPALRALRERILRGDFGHISQLACLQWDAEPPSAHFRSHSGGIAVDMGVHEIDQARWLTGQEVAWLTAAGGGDDAAGRDPDVAVIAAQLTGGAVATMSVGRRFPHGDCCWLEVIGTDGYARLPFMWGDAGQQVFHAALIAQAEAFAATARGAPAAGADGDDAVAAIKAAELAGEALVVGRRHDVPASVAE